MTGFNHLRLSMCINYLLLALKLPQIPVSSKLFIISGTVYLGGSGSESFMILLSKCWPGLQFHLKA